jgi:hypothetical protein
MQYTVDEIRNLVDQAKAAAYEAADAHEKEYYPDNGWGACGFAWVNIWGIKGNTKLGRVMKAAGIEKDYSGAHSIWNPSKYPTQNVSTLEAGAQAAAKVFKDAGFTAYAGSRLD